MRDQASRILEAMVKRRRNDALWKIERQAGQFEAHLLKVFLFPHTRWVKGWKTELWAWALAMQRITLDMGRKRLNQKEYKSALHEGLVVTLFTNQIKSVLYDMSGQSPRISASELKANLRPLMEHFNQFYLELSAFMAKEALTKEILDGMIDRFATWTPEDS